MRGWGPFFTPWFYIRAGFFSSLGLLLFRFKKYKFFMVHVLDLFHVDLDPDSFHEDLDPDLFHEDLDPDS